jgi:excinuclease ABC subunit C
MVGLAKRLELIIVPCEKPGPAIPEPAQGTFAVAVEEPVVLPSVGMGAASRQKGIDNPALRVKDPDYSYDRPAPKEYDYSDVELPLNSPGLMLLRKLRDEAHRFALSYHRKLRDKRTTGSALEEIPGVGPRRRRLLLRTFGSINGIRRATVDELAAVPTMTKRLAEQIHLYLRDDGE